jgi:hypothetical protein
MLIFWSRTTSPGEIWEESFAGSSANTETESAISVAPRGDRRANMI